MLPVAGPRARSLFASALICSLVLVTCAGCPKARRGGAGRSAATIRASQQSLSQQSALLNSIRDQLRDLPELAQMQIAPPRAVLDARSTTDGKPILAVLLRANGAPDGPANRLVVPRANCRFREIVQSGDIVKYFAELDRETQERLAVDENLTEDMLTFEPVADLFVAQVLKNNELLLSKGFTAEVRTPRRLEIWRIADDRMDELDRTLGEYLVRRNPALAWQPSPDEGALEQLTERMNQWLRQTRLAGPEADAAGWERPKLIETLPAEVASEQHVAALLADEQLGAGYFTADETRRIQAATWRRDVARWGRGSATSPLDTASALLDWMTRNVQLVADDATPPRWPWESLLHGQATADGMAWVFVGLCQQRKLTAAVIEVPVEGEAGAYPLVGVSDGESLRVFDPQIGLPISGSDGEGAASLAELAEDDSLLRSLDLPGHPYPVTAEALGQAVVFVVAEPLALTRRAEAFASKLPPEDAVVLAVDIDAEAQRIAEVAGVESVKLWPVPAHTLVAKHKAKKSQRAQAVREFLPFAWRPQLWRGRLQHFRGDSDRGDKSEGITPENIDDHMLAGRLYMNPAVRPKEELLARVPQDKRAVYRLAKITSTLFLAQLSFDGGNHRVSKRWLMESTFEDEAAKPYEDSVRYNRGRAMEALGETSSAIEAYESVDGPMRRAAGLRARRLREAAPDGAVADEADAA